MRLILDVFIRRRRKGGQSVATMAEKAGKELAGQIPDEDGGALSYPRGCSGGGRPGLLSAVYDISPADFPQQSSWSAGSGCLGYFHGAGYPAARRGGRSGGELSQLCQPDLQPDHAVVRTGVHHLFPHAGGGLPDDGCAEGLPPAPAQKPDSLYGKGAAVHGFPLSDHRAYSGAGYGGPRGAGICRAVCGGAGGVY